MYIATYERHTIGFLGKVHIINDIMVEKMILTLYSEEQLIAQCFSFAVDH